MKKWIWRTSVKAKIQRASLKEKQPWAMETMQKGFVMEMLCKKEKEGSIQSKKKEAYCFVHSTLGQRKWLK